MCMPFCLFHCQGCGPQQNLKRMDQEGLKDVVKQGLVYFEREERDLHMLLFPEVLDQVIFSPFALDVDVSCRLKMKF